jgi:hypothetical protein
MNLLLEMRQSDRKMLIDSCINFYARELKIDKKNFTLAIFSTKGLAKDIGANGMAYRIEDKIYSMHLDSRISMENLIQVIAHEMVHIKQFVRGQISFKGRSMYWLGNKVIKSKINYYDHPWEIDAWSKEKVLSAKIYKILAKLQDKHYGKIGKL